jgi:hypothetical protein
LELGVFEERDVILNESLFNPWIQSTRQEAAGDDDDWLLKDSYSDITKKIFQDRFTTFEQPM